VTSFLTNCPGTLADSIAPAGIAGAHDTEVTPIACVPGS
jgi:hypothetical protein